MSSHGSGSGSFSHSAGLVLRVHRGDGHTDEVYIALGLTIGRSVANTVNLMGDETIGRTHARIEVAENGSKRLCCVDPGSTLTVGQRTVRELPLAPGIDFSIGRFRFECVAGQHVRSNASALHFPACPLCGSNEVATDGEGVTPCPDCNEPVLLIPRLPGNAGLRLVPVKFGDYRAEQFVACGGMGVVLKGVHRKGHRLVAIKLLKHADLNGSSVERFEQEVDMLARVRHPNVVQLLDHGQAGRFRFLVMEWIEGKALKDVIVERQRHDRLVPFDAARRGFEQVLKGLAAIHRVGVIHRDIKPSNILIGTDNRIRIADLGLARPFDGLTSGLTTTGQAPGSFAYMAPEQINAPETVDQRTDLYAAGVTFYEVLTGTRPIGAWQPASVINPTVPPSFDELLSRLLATDREQRFSDVREVLADLDAAAVSTPPVSSPGGSSAPIAVPATSADRSANNTPASRILDDPYTTRMLDTDRKVINVISREFDIPATEIQLDSRLEADLGLDEDKRWSLWYELEETLLIEADQMYDRIARNCEPNTVGDVIEFVKVAKQRPLDCWTPRSEDWHPDDPRWLDWERWAENEVEKVGERYSDFLAIEPRQRCYFYVAATVSGIFLGLLVLKAIGRTAELQPSHLLEFVLIFISVLISSAFANWGKLLIGLVSLFIALSLSGVKASLGRDIDRQIKNRDDIRSWRREKRQSVQEQERWESNRIVSQ